MEALKVLSGYGEPLRGRVMMLDLGIMEVHCLTLTVREGCPDCAHLR
jgi:adenylyltransferase/sulfurtransferase